MNTYTPCGMHEYLDGKIVEYVRETKTGRKSAAFKATPAKGSASHMLTSERDARRWIDECQTGGNLAGFMHELQSRRRWR